MAVEVTFGKVGITPRGPWDADYNDGKGYALLDGVLYNHDTWVSKVDGNKAEPGTDATKWFQGTDSGIAAHEAADEATAAAQSANEAAEAAREAVEIAKLPEVATESDVRAIVSGYSTGESSE